MYRKAVCSDNSIQNEPARLTFAVFDPNMYWILRRLHNTSSINLIFIYSGQENFVPLDTGYKRGGC